MNLFDVLKAIPLSVALLVVGASLVLYGCLGSSTPAIVTGVLLFITGVWQKVDT